MPKKTEDIKKVKYSKQRESNLKPGGKNPISNGPLCTNRSYENTKLRKDPCGSR